MDQDTNKNDIYGCSVENLDEYRYSSLPSNRHIRLLHIHPLPQRSADKSPSPFYNDKETIHISVETHSLDDKPEQRGFRYFGIDKYQSIPGIDKIDKYRIP
jgi:hypothetical protein